METPESKLVEQLKAIAGEEAVFVDEPMSAHTTFRVGGPADVLVMPRTADEACRTVSLVREIGCTLYIMGRGSNLLVADAGLRGVVVQIASNLSDISVGEGGVVVAEAGASNSKIAAMARDAGLAGYEFAAGIPGSVGGAAIMNAGAYDGEFKDVAIEVTCLDSQGAIVKLAPDQAEWGYRTSAIDRLGLIVLSVKLQLHPGDPSAIQARMDDLASRRQSKQPLDKPSAGSTFKRPPGLFAGKLIQDAGMQGYQVGGAQVSTKHAGFVVNVGGATAADVLQVIQDVQATVLEQQGVMLQPEVRMWGFE
ncbi:MAG: UDP-N-acetylmuramate dehydrogenase [Eggerthellaceae bacterium]|nr:UDP-N-acetylmuramate dehydrogenase [Eggerthellaceae bacterium]